MVINQREKIVRIVSACSFSPLFKNYASIVLSQQWGCTFITVGTYFHNYGDLRRLGRKVLRKKAIIMLILAQ